MLSQRNGRFLVLLVALTVGLAGCGAGGSSVSVDEDDLVISSTEVLGEGNIVIETGTGEGELISLLPEQILVMFNDGSTETVTVFWDVPDNFNPNSSGEYTFTGTFTASGVTDSTAITVSVLGVVDISQNITQNTLLTADNIYRVTSSIDISAGLTIEPGTVIRFQQGTNFRVQSGGHIAANGTEEDRILFTGTEKQRGWWDGIQIRNRSSQNTMDWVIIEYDGGSTFESRVDEANLVVGGRTGSSDGRLELNNSIVRQSGGFGLHIRIESELPDSANNQYTANAAGAAIMRANSLHFLDDASDYAGNDSDFVVVEDSRSGNVIDASDQRTWQALNVPYRVNGNLSIDNSEITINAGAEFEFTDSSSFRFLEDSVIKVGGGLSQFETRVPETVLFTGVEKTPGYWQGIQIRSSRSGNFMDNVIIEYGGSSAFESNVPKANLVVGGRISSYNGRLMLQNSTLRHSSGHGLAVQNESDFSGSSNNRYTQNQEGPAIMKVNSIHFLDSGSDYTGNQSANDHIDVKDASNGPVIDSSDERTWQALNVPYRFDGNSIQIENSHITILPGASFEFTTNSALRFMEDSKLTAEGTENQPIVFSGRESIPGFWEGLQIRSERNNTMEHVVIEYAGSGTFEFNLQEANLVVGGRITRGKLTLRDSVLRNSAGYGLELRDGSSLNTDFDTANEFSGNVEGPYYIE